MEKKEKGEGVPAITPSASGSQSFASLRDFRLPPNANTPAYWLIVSKVNRYKCVHCKKVGYSAGHMRRHAKRCTANPDRKCGMHYKENLFDRSMRHFDGFDVKEKVQAAIALLPDPAKYHAGADEFGCDAYPGLEEAAISVMPEVSTAVDGCPACILAALRQRGMPFALNVFDFKKATDEWREAANGMLA